MFPQLIYVFSWRKFTTYISLLKWCNIESIPNYVYMKLMVSITINACGVWCIRGEPKWLTQIIILTASLLSGVILVVSCTDPSFYSATLDTLAAKFMLNSVDMKLYVLEWISFCRLFPLFSCSICLLSQFLSELKAQPQWTICCCMWRWWIYYLYSFGMEE